MNTMAPIRPAELYAYRVHLTTGPAAAGRAVYSTLALQPHLARGGGRSLGRMPEPLFPGT
jgi:hypothetical protein